LLKTINTTSQAGGQPSDGTIRASRAGHREKERQKLCANETRKRCKGGKLFLNESRKTRGSHLTQGKELKTMGGEPAKSIRKNRQV